MNDQALPFRIAPETASQLSNQSLSDWPAPDNSNQLNKLFETAILTNCVVSEGQEFCRIPLHLFIDVVVTGRLVVDAWANSTEIWKGYEDVPIEQRALHLLGGFWGMEAAMGPLLATSEEELEKAQQLFAKVEHPERVKSFEEGKEIAQRVHRYTALLSQGFIILLYYHLCNDHFHLLSEYDEIELSFEEAHALVGDDPVFLVALQGIGGCMQIDSELERLQWSGRAVWPDSYEPPSVDDMQRELREAVTILTEEQRLQAPETLASYKERCITQLNEVEAAIEEVEEFEWEGFGVERPLTYELYRHRLLMYRDLLSIRKRLLLRLSRECLGGVFRAASPWDNQKTPQQQSQQRGTVEERAANVFAGKSRPPGVGTQIASDVRAWAVESFYTFCQEGHTREEAKDRVLGLAERHSYHFSRRWLQKEIKRQSGS